MKTMMNVAYKILYILSFLLKIVEVDFFIEFILISLVFNSLIKFDLLVKIANLKYKILKVLCAIGNKIIIGIIEWCKDSHKYPPHANMHKKEMLIVLSYPVKLLKLEKIWEA